LTDYEIGLVRTDRDSVIGQLISNELLDRDAATLKLDGESFPVHGFEKAIAERVMDVKEGLDDLAREV
jgi:hypothetical protein